MEQVISRSGLKKLFLAVLFITNSILLIKISALPAHASCCEMQCRKINQDGSGEDKAVCVTVQPNDICGLNNRFQCPPGFQSVFSAKASNDCKDEPYCTGKDIAPVAEQQTVPAFGLNPLCPAGSKDCSVPTIIGRIIRAVLGIVGSLALVMFVYGGFLWMISSSQGNDKKVAHAKDVLVWATMGLLVIFASYTIVNFILEQVAK